VDVNWERQLGKRRARQRIRAADTSSIMNLGRPSLPTAPSSYDWQWFYERLGEQPSIDQKEQFKQGFCEVLQRKKEERNAGT